MNDNAKPWDKFMRTVQTVTASSLAFEDLRAVKAHNPSAGDEATTVSESFIALAASADGPRERAELRNARRNLSIVLIRSEGGVEVEIAASGFASIRDWRGARGLLGFPQSGISSTITFDDQGRAAHFLAGADINALARDAVTLERI